MLNEFSYMVLNSHMVQQQLHGVSEKRSWSNAVRCRVTSQADSDQ